MSIHHNLITIQEGIRKAAERSGRNFPDIKLVVAGKYADAQTLQEAIEAGVKIIGENKAQDLRDKYKILGDQVEWHFIGHLQSNKVKYVAPIVTLIHSLDSEKLVIELEKYLTKINKRLKILIEVNTSGESTKHGVDPQSAAALAAVCKKLSHLELVGLMTMGADVDNPDNNRPHFRSLKKLADQLQLKELSMGTTRDFEVAIEEGATIVRIGSAIFK